MQFARIIAKWFKPEEPDFAALGAKLRQLAAGEIGGFELPPGVSFVRLLPECPKCGYRAEPGADGGEDHTQGGRVPGVAGDLSRARAAELRRGLAAGG